MKYQSLYRKYRPTSFEEVYGQKNVKKILRNSIIKNQISHAYLFYGPRGTGKTSIAKMFARICNCLNNQNGECCNQCQNCIESSQKSCVDVIEIDAASNNGVDEIRELKNKINLVPNKLKYKVYIIDEVHMLSIGAFNALLKTLEEPPEHIIFILATTEYQKVPATIISRCQTLEFKKIDVLDLYDRLKEISEKENINISDSALKEIAKYSDGGMRDAIGILEKANLFNDPQNEISLDDIHECYGMISDEDINELFNLIQNRNKDNCLSFIENHINSDKDILKIVSQLIKKYRDEIVISKKYNLINEINLIDKYYEKIKLSSNYRIMFEILIVELCELSNKRSIIKNNENVIEITEKKQEKNKSELHNLENNCELNSTVRINNSFAEADKNSLIILKNKWKLLKDYSFDLNFGSLCCDLSDAVPVVFGKNNLIVSSEYESCVNKINENYDKYQDLIKKILDFDIKIVAVSQEKWKELKTEYINNIKSGYVYKYTDEESVEKENNLVNLIKKDDIISSSNITNKAIDLFGEITV